MGCWSTVDSVLLHHTITPPFRYPISALSAKPRGILTIERLEPFERFELQFESILLLPATAQGSVELHHGIELSASNPGQR
jgi:hypothetical protein